MMKISSTLIMSVAALVAVACPRLGHGADPLVTDSRIKTYIYSSTEVFPITTHFGYQSYIEFAPGEDIRTIALGYSDPWQINTIDNRIFIKPMDGYSHTNMTVITSRRSYQFDLESKLPPDVIDENLTYVVRFYYPEELPGVGVASLGGVSGMGGMGNVGMMDAAPLSYNLNYTLSGPEHLAPLRVFDDGKATYFQFSPHMSVLPVIQRVESGGVETMLPSRRVGEFIVVDAVAEQFILRLGQDAVCVFNEA